MVSKIFLVTNGYYEITIEIFLNTKGDYYFKQGPSRVRKADTAVVTTWTFHSSHNYLSKQRDLDLPDKIDAIGGLGSERIFPAGGGQGGGPFFGEPFFGIFLD